MSSEPVLVSAVSPPFAVAAALLALAGASKLRAAHAAPLTRAAGVGELALGAVALAHPGALVAALVACAYVGFAGHVIRMLASGHDEPCGCFGAQSERAGAAHLTVDLAAAVVAGLAVAAPPHGLGWLVSLSPALALTLACGVAAATYAAYLVLTALPSAWRAYGAGSRV